MLPASQAAFEKDFVDSDYLAVSYEQLADFETPLSLFIKLEGRFLLESVEKGRQVGKYSIIAGGKNLAFKAEGKKFSLQTFTAGGGVKEENGESDNPLLALEEITRALRLPAALRRCPAATELPLAGGMIGYLGYEAAGYFEVLPSFPAPSEKEHPLYGVPEVYVVIPRYLAIYNNVKRQLTLNLLVEGERRQSQGGAVAYRAAQAELKSLVDKIKAPLSYQAPSPVQSSAAEAVESNLAASTYQARVEKALYYIREGEVIQTVLSQRFSRPLHTSALECYRTLKQLNPSPYLYYLNFETFEMVGSSPEVMVQLMGEDLLLKPIAGTRRRGTNETEDEKLKQELLSDEKEKSEHLMLVDLGRNDLGKVAEPGSVRVENYLSVEQYSHVQHLVSTVKAKKRQRGTAVSAFELIKATFPAGTLSGAPKVRAMELIHELEQEKRGPYGGMVFYLGFNGNLDSCITIRTMLIRQGRAYVQTGAGIVADSTPAGEQAECENKAKALLDAIDKTYLRLAEEFGSGGRA